MKLEVGMYVRTKKGIGKIETIEEDRTEIHFNCDSGLSIGFVKRGFTQEEIVNMFEHNYDIIELVKVGDYVNGYKIERVDEPCQLNPYGSVKFRIDGNYDYEEILGNEIKTIVTKEQFEAMAYKVV